MRRFFIHCSIASGAAFVAYKSLIACCFKSIPGQPFYGFHVQDWMDWLVSPREFFFIVAVTAVEYTILSFILLRWLRRNSAVVVWGAAFGLYVGVLTYPLDVMSRID